MSLLLDVPGGALRARNAPNKHLRRIDLSLCCHARGSASRCHSKRCSPPCTARTPRATGQSVTTCCDVRIGERSPADLHNPIHLTIPLTPQPDTSLPTTTLRQTG